MPAVKAACARRLPRSFGTGPRIWLRAVFWYGNGGRRYLDININGDIAIVKSKVKEHPLEMRMQRQSAIGKIVGVKDDQLATEIARKIGQEIIAVAKNGDNDTAERLGIGNL